MGPGSGSFQSLCSDPLPTAHPAHLPRAPLTCRLWLWAWARAPHARSRLTLSSTSALAALGSTPCLSNLKARAGSRRSRAAASAHSRAARAAGDWPSQLSGGQCAMGAGILVLALPRCSSVHSPYPGGAGPTAHLPEEEREGPGPNLPAVGAQTPQLTSLRSPDPIAHQPLGVPDYPLWGLTPPGFSCVTPLTQEQPGERPPRHLGYPWLRPRPHSHGDCPASPG